MTAEEAIHELKFDKGLYESEICYAGDGTPEGDLLQALDMAIEALEKQIPYKPKTKKLFFGVGKCKCGSEFLNKESVYCAYCGQKLNWEDWSEEE